MERIKIFSYLCTQQKGFIMSNSRTITIKNPSRKLEEKIREAGDGKT